jgi:hypothetical protein
METRMRRLIASLVVGLIMLIPTVTVAEAPDATIELTGGSVAVGVGYSWGEGTVVYKGETHKFKISGLSIADVGISSYTASGSVFRLKDLKDIEGTYSAATAGVTIAGGVSGTVMKNDHGVVIELAATRAGLQFTLAPSGMKITLVK